MEENGRPSRGSGVGVREVDTRQGQQCVTDAVDLLLTLMLCHGWVAAAVTLLETVVLSAWGADVAG